MGRPYQGETGGAYVLVEDGHELLQRVLVELERGLGRYEAALLRPLSVVQAFLLLPHLSLSHTLVVGIRQETCHRDGAHIVRRHD